MTDIRDIINEMTLIIDTIETNLNNTQDVLDRQYEHLDRLKGQLEVLKSI